MSLPARAVEGSKASAPAVAPAAPAPGSGPLGLLSTCYEFGLRGRGAPDRVLLIPAGRELTGRDGQRWVFEAERARNATAANQALIPVDFNHATELKAGKGEETPAAGWITQVDVQDGALWASIEWTDRGRYAVLGRSYRYLSPAFHFDPKTREIGRIASVALVNKPNLRLPALNREEGTMDEETKAGATGPEASAANAAPGASGGGGQPAPAPSPAGAPGGGGQPAPAPAAQSEAAAAPALTAYVPRADYDLAVARAAAAERRLGEARAGERSAEIEAEVSAALKAGRIAPASADYHRQACAAEGGLERFRAFLRGQPEIAGPSGLAGKSPAPGAPALSAESARVAAMFGNSAEDLNRYGGAAAGE